MNAKPYISKMVDYSELALREICPQIRGLFQFFEEASQVRIVLFPLYTREHCIGMNWAIAIATWLWLPNQTWGHRFPNHMEIFLLLPMCEVKSYPPPLTHRVRAMDILERYFPLFEFLKGYSRATCLIDAVYSITHECKQIVYIQ
jgi:hypothetical protein